MRATLRCPVMVMVVCACLWHEAGAAARVKWWDPAWERRAALDIQKGIALRLSGFPLIVPVGFLGLPKGINWDSIRVVGPAGKELPAQVDDLDGSPGITGQDELVFLIDLESEETRAYLYFSSSKRIARPRAYAGQEIQVSFTRDGEPQFDNGRIRLRDGKFAYRLSSAGPWVDVLSGDGSFVFDAYNFGGSQVPGWKTQIVARGPVRTVARRASTALVPTDKAQGRPIVPARVVHEWHVYRGRKECFVSSQIQNAGSAKDVLLVARGWAWLDVTPGGRYTPEDYWTAAIQGVRRVRPASAGLDKYMRLSEGWFDAYTDGPTDKPRVNLGLVFHPLSARYRVWAGERTKRFRVVVMNGGNWPQVPPRGRLWFGFWLCPHEGGPDQVRDLWRARRSVDAIPGAIEDRE